MKHADFVHLHNHSDYSLLDGASSIPGMVERAAELGMPALALTDHGSLFGAVEFYQEARKAGVKPILGMEAYVTRGSRRDRTRDTAHHLVLLARDEQGFRNLIKLSSYAFLEGFYYRPRVDHELLASHAQGLVALSACPKGEVATDLLADDEDGAARTASMYRDMFGADHYFLEIQNHGLEIEDRIRERVTRLARRTGIPLVATNDCHYLKHEHAAAHDVLLCIQTGKNVEDAQRMRYETDQVYFKSAEEMRQRFADQPEALANTLAIAERCNVAIQFGRPLLPEFPLPPGVSSPVAYLRELAWAGVGDRYRPVSEEVRQRFEYELDVICRMGFASYFLIVRDFIRFAREQGIGVGPGRGSVAGSLIAYALRITDIDPLQHHLIFERFLNPERVSMPDIDIDFDDLRRGEVIDYVKRTYGDQNVTQIITFGTMGAKGVIRDVGRALGLAFAEVDKIAKLVPDGLGMTLDRALELSGDLRNLPQRGPQFGRLLDTARVLEGLARHASTHAAGVLITPGPVMEHVPLYRQKDESVTTQWDMKAVEKIGLLKMDFLGLRTLSVLQEAERLIREHRGVAIDVATLPADDPTTFERVFQTAETIGIFQFESSGMRDYLRRLKPTVFDDLVAMNALYRPGPMENIPYFIDCKHGRQVARYEHPDLEPILKGTYGVFVYQEQVMQAANVLAGFSMAQADELRRAMGKKRPEEMDAKRQAFVEGARHKRIPPAKAEKIFQTMEKFAGYGFNKCVTGDTEIIDAVTGERTTVGDLHVHTRPFTVHALGEDLRLAPRRVTDVFANGPKPVFELTTRSGHRIRATANHPLYTLEGWKCVDELAPGQRIAAARRLPVETNSHWPEHELIALAGLLSEGNTCHPTTLYFYANDRAFVDDFHGAIGAFPDTVSCIAQRRDGRFEVRANLGRDYRVREVAGPHAAYDIEGNLALVMDAPGRRSGAFRWAERLGIIGRKATEKRVPGPVFELADDCLELFLGRLWTGDGYLAGPRRDTPFYATSSPELARDVQSLLLRLGILSTSYRKSFRYRGTRRDGYAVHVMGDRARELFIERIVPHIVGRESQVARIREIRSTTAADRSSRDTIPIGIQGVVNAARLERGLRWSDLEAATDLCLKDFQGRPPRTKRGYRRSTIARLAVAMGSATLGRVAASDVYWDTIVSIEPQGVEDTFDLTVEHDHNFVANGLVVHNSHSAAYAQVAYQSAYLKAHHPAEFMAATLTSEMADSSRIVTLIEECRRLRLALLPPDVNRSEWRFTIEGDAIRFGLGAVRNVGQAVVDAIVTAREGGAFKDLFDFAARLDARTLNRRVLESLVAAGACDGLGGERAALFAAAERVLAHAASLHRERVTGQSSLFGADAGGGVAVSAPVLPFAPPWGGRERSTREKEVLGFYLTEHPLEPLRDELPRIASHSIAQALEEGDGAEVRLAGILMECRTITTRTGRLMAAVTLEDLSGRVECTVFPDTWEQAKALLVVDEIVVLGGRVEVSEDRGTKLLISEARRMDEARTMFRPVLHLEVAAQDLDVAWMEGVDEILSSHPGEAEVYLLIVMPDRARQASRSRRFRVAEGDAVVTALRQRFPGLRAWWGKGAA